MTTKPQTKNDDPHCMTHDGHHHMTHRLGQCERRQPRGRNLFHIPQKQKTLPWCPHRNTAISLFDFIS